LAETPYGQTTTYGALARQVGGGISPRAIGGFVGHNPLSIFIACIEWSDQPENSPDTLAACTASATCPR
jgi:hypothetical protein